MDLDVLLGQTTDGVCVRDQPIDDLERACASWEKYLGLASCTQRPFVRSLLADRLARDGGGWFAPCEERALVIAWQVTR